MKFNNFLSRIRKAKLLDNGEILLPNGKTLFFIFFLNLIRNLYNLYIIKG